MQHPVLTAEDWLELALNELKEQGYGALKALPLSKKLNVTRGSFYHHFDNLDDFHRSVIAHWSKRSSGEVIRAAVNASEPVQALDDLLQQTLRSGERLERAVRSWATVHSLVAEEVEKVDRARIDVAKQLLIKAGVARKSAGPRSQILYWAAIGRLMLPFPDRNLLTAEEITELAMLMLRE